MNAEELHRAYEELNDRMETQIAALDEQIPAWIDEMIGKGEGIYKAEKLAGVMRRNAEDEYRHQRDGDMRRIINRYMRERDRDREVTPEEFVILAVHPGFIYMGGGKAAFNGRLYG